MQELIDKKREIIDIFLKKGILLSSELINELKSEKQVFNIFETLKSKKLEEITVMDLALEKLLNSKPQLSEENHTNQETTKTQTTEKQEAQKTQDSNVKIIFSYKDEPKKREPSDFVDYFTNRYKAIEKFLKQRQELQNTISIGKLLNKKEKEAITIIGIVNEKQATKNGNLMLVLEDPTGQIKVLVNKNKPQLFNEAQDIVYDEVIGVSGVNVDGFIFANNIIWPDIPTTDIKKGPDEKYAIFLSDLHVGSNKFLPEDFEKFLKWINCEMGNEQQKNIARNVKYIFIAGDLVDGVGIYPEQDKELAIKDIHDQYRQCAELLKKIPIHIPLVICPGNHDAMRISEPQPLFSKNFAKPLYEIPNAIMVTNPAIVNIDSSPDFSGFDVLLYHGYSFDYFVANVDSLRNQGGYDRADLIMKFLLKRRHVAPTHLSTLYIPDTKKDPLVIEKAPDFFLSGHIHKTATANYRGTTLICGSCWQAKTLFQEKVGHNPEPSRVPIVNLKTREVKILKFGQ